MILDPTKLKNDLLTQPTLYLEYFPSLKPLIQELLDRPDCPTCLGKVITHLLKDPNRGEKLSYVYGEPVDIKLNSPKISSGQWVVNTEVREVKVEDYKDWIIERLKPISGQKIKLLSTFSYVSTVGGLRNMEGGRSPTVNTVVVTLEVTTSS